MSAPQDLNDLVEIVAGDLEVINEMKRYAAKLDPANAIEFTPEEAVGAADLVRHMISHFARKTHVATAGEVETLKSRIAELERNMMPFEWFATRVRNRFNTQEEPFFEYPELDARFSFFEALDRRMKGVKP